MAKDNPRKFRSGQEVLEHYVPGYRRFHVESEFARTSEAVTTVENLTKTTVDRLRSKLESLVQDKKRSGGGE